jgi:very-short-patch-repair endonuclease
MENFNMSHLEETLAFHLKAAKIDFEREYHYLSDMPRVRCDFFFKKHNLIVEIEGGVTVWVDRKPVRGRHTSHIGFIKDCLKYNKAAILGYTVMRMAPEHVNSGQALKWIEEFIEAKNENRI